MVLNVALRFFWLIGIFHYNYEDDPENFWNQFKVLVIGKIFAEALRRTVWAIIRVENEMFNNFE